jgi:uncharacterized membrane protein
MYLLFYSFGGFVLERIINLVFLGYWWDNSVLYGPYQPLYGNGVVLLILFAEFVYPKIHGKTFIRIGIYMLVAILFTALSEASTGYFFEWLTGIHLWDYGQTFPCQLEYICLIPTTMFGLLSFLVVYYLHPIFKLWLDRTPSWLSLLLLLIFMTDIVWTFVVLNQSTIIAW